MMADGGPAPACPPQAAATDAREFGTRAVSAVVLAAIVLAALLVGGWPFALVWLVAGIVWASEWIAMARLAPARALLVTTCAALVCLVAGPRLGVPPATVAALAALGGAATVVAARAGTRLRAVGGLLSAATVALVPPALRDDPAIGVLGPAWMFAVVWSTDVIAYLTGRTLGGPKLMPRVSPKKTWSGALGGLAAGTLAGAAVVLVARDHGGVPLPLGLAALASAAASTASQAGDLAESALKRVYGVKDSGSAIPGHGGVMDRLDGFFAVALLAGLSLLAYRLTAA